MNNFDSGEVPSSKLPVAAKATAFDALGLNHDRRASRSHDEKLQSFTLQVERKSFVFTLMENERGQFLRITEGIIGRRNHIIIPSTGLAEFSQLVAAMNTVPDRRQA